MLLPQFTRPDGAQFSFNIMAVARIPSSTATGGVVVRVQTASGILTLSNGVWSASNITGPLLDQVFPATGGRRSLLEGTSASKWLQPSSSSGQAATELLKACLPW